MACAKPVSLTGRKSYPCDNKQRSSFTYFAVHRKNPAIYKRVQINIPNGLSVLMDVLFDQSYTKYFINSTLTIISQLQMQITT
jgi:hypothetical protein